MSLPVRKATKLSEAMVWHHFVPRSGPQGAAWYEQYHSSGCQEVAVQLDTAVAMMRRRQVDEGKALLDRSHPRMQELSRQGLPRSVHGVIEEAYWSGSAYYYYHAEQFEQARAALDAAQQVLSEVVSEAPFLHTFATRCYDLSLHYARVARGLRRWQDMWTFIQQAREMVRSERPLCRTRWGAVHMEDAYAFFRSAQPENEVEREALGYLLDQDKLLSVFEQRALGATLIPTAVVAW